MKSVPYSDELLGKLIIALGRTKRIGNTNIMKILDEVDNPRTMTTMTTLPGAS